MDLSPAELVGTYGIELGYWRTAVDSTNLNLHMKEYRSAQSQQQQSMIKSYTA